MKAHRHFARCKNRTIFSMTVLDFFFSLSQAQVNCITLVFWQVLHVTKINFPFMFCLFAFVVKSLTLNCTHAFWPIGKVIFF